MGLMEGRIKQVIEYDTQIKYLFLNQLEIYRIMAWIISVQVS